MRNSENLQIPSTTGHIRNKEILKEIHGANFLSNHSFYVVSLTRVVK
jgi:hypothetical protein